MYFFFIVIINQLINYVWTLKDKEQIVWQTLWNEKGTIFYVIHNGFCYITGAENLPKKLLCNDPLSEKKGETNAYFELYKLPFFCT